MEAIPLNNITAETVAKALYNKWISRFGTPSRLINDRTAESCSQTFQALTQSCSETLLVVALQQNECGLNLNYNRGYRS